MDNPFQLFGEWFTKAAEAGIKEPEAMTLATVSPSLRPTARVVLLKGRDEEKFTFFTNYGSRKAQDLITNPQATLLFHWPAVERQIRIEGRVKKASDEVSDEYFATRPRLSQIGAWASNQSRPMPGYFQLEKNVARESARFVGRKVSRPPFWGGFHLYPDYFEFWEAKAFRRHLRWIYTPSSDNGQPSWDKQFLFP
ncbi:MAG: pyridoxamine 5'-phosphate oxidase [Opitutales bacterium]|nr:pyridoxamine 5'-phosphate oxidase [Opitutales bacterium]MCH8540161.1 pyridoxamine 5'-phosphate oxidase [Opitutales bacterium]